MKHNDRVNLLGTRIRERREALGMSQEALAFQVGYKSRTSINKIELGKTDLVQSTILRIADALQTTPAYLTGWDEAPSAAPSEGNPVVPIYHALNDAGKKELLRYGRYLGEQSDYQAEDDKPEVEYIRHYLVPAAAGYASPIEGEDYDLIPKDSKTPYNADFCIDIDGDSMEPYIHDGQKVYVQRDASLTDFDVGIFFVDGDVYCKQYCIDCFGTLYLLSANPKREDANITIRPDSGQTVICFGKVILPKKLPQPIYR